MTFLNPKLYNLFGDSMNLTADMITMLNNRVSPVIFESVHSTNLVAKDLALQGASEGTLVIAGRQTAGVGRCGRTFFSPDGGIYMSLILRPTQSKADFLFITVAAAVALSQSIERLSGKKCYIKWVNDIYIDDKKVCGILTQGRFSLDGNIPEYAVLGVGINLVTPKDGFPDEISGIAGSVFDKESVPPKVKAELTADFCERFFSFYDYMESKTFLEEYRLRSYLTGKKIEYGGADGVLHTATVTGIDDNARLIVRENGKTVKLNSGDIKIKRT